MEEENRNIVKFEMSNYCKFVFYKFCIIGQWITGLVFIDFVIHGIKAKQSLMYFLTGPFILCIVMSFLCLIAFWKVRYARFATELNIDKEKREFRAYIYDIKKEVKFGTNDILEVIISPELFRFCLKDATWVSWAKDGRNNQLLEEIIKSFGIPIIKKRIKYWDTL